MFRSPLTLIQNDYQQGKIYADIGKRNHFSLLVGMQTGVAMMEISMISKQLKIQL